MEQTTDNLIASLWKLVAIVLVVFAVLLIIKLLFKFVFSQTTLGKKINKNAKPRSQIRGSGLEISRNPSGFIFGKKRKKKVYMKDTSEGHMVIFGGSGKGKTSALLIPSLRAWHGSFFAIDISGDINSNVECDKKYLISPDEPEKSVCFNIFHDVDCAITEQEKRQKLEILANRIIGEPNKNANSAEVYFSNMAKLILNACFLAFYNIGFDFIDICKMAFMKSTVDLFEAIIETKNDRALAYIQPMFKSNEENINGVKQHLNDKLRLFADNVNMEKILKRPTGNEKCISSATLEDGHIFLVIPDKKQEYYSAFMNLITAQFLDYIGARSYNRGKDKRIFIALDEFASLGHIDIVPPFRKFRKNGANICILTQSLADIDLVYNEKERKVILDNCLYQVILNSNDPDTREEFSKMVGKYTYVDKKGNEKEEYIIKPTYWKTMKKEVIVIHTDGYAKLKKNFYFK